MVVDYRTHGIQTEFLSLSLWYWHTYTFLIYLSEIIRWPWGKEKPLCQNQREILCPTTLQGMRRRFWSDCKFLQEHIVFNWWWKEHRFQGVNIKKMQPLLVQASFLVWALSQQEQWILSYCTLPNITWIIKFLVFCICSPLWTIYFKYDSSYQGGFVESWFYFVSCWFELKQEQNKLQI